MQEEKSQSPIWKYVAVISVIVALPSSFLAFLQVKEMMREDGPQFTISTKTGPFKVPEGTLKEAMFNVLREPESNDIDTESKTIQYDLDDLKSFSIISMKNSGNLPAKNVRLKTGSEGFARIEWDDGAIENMHFVEDVQLNTIEIQKAVSVSLWTKDELIFSDAMSLIHDTGSVPVSFAQQSNSVTSKLLSSVIVAFIVIMFSLVALISFIVKKLRTGVDSLRNALVETVTEKSKLEERLLATAELLEIHEQILKRIEFGNSQEQKK